MIKRVVKQLLGESLWQSLRYRLRHHIPRMGKAEIYNYQTNLVVRRVVTDLSFCIDVGCHKGFVLGMILKQAPSSQCLAVEPLPEMFAYLQTRYGARPNVRLVNAALSDAASTTEFCHVVNSPEYSGLRHRKVYGGAAQQEVTITVQTVRLDDLVPSTAKVDLMKVDVEGAELQVFAGGIETIRRSRPVIIFEHGLGAADHFGVTPEKIYELLHDQCGLRISVMENWLAGGPALGQAEFCEHFYRDLDFYYLAHP